MGIFQSLMEKVIKKGSTQSSISFDFNALDDQEIESLNKLMDTGFTLKNC